MHLPRGCSAAALSSTLGVALAIRLAALGEAG